LLLVLLYGQEAGAVDGHHDFLQGGQQLPGLLALAVVQDIVDQVDEVQPQLEVRPVGCDAVPEVARHQLTVRGGLGVAEHPVLPGRDGIFGTCVDDGLQQVVKLIHVQLGLLQELLHLLLYGMGHSRGHLLLSEG